MTEIEEFLLPGYRFYQEFRKCNKDACKSCRDGHGHGPYWFRRNHFTGRVKYIGKKLPDEVLEAKTWYEQQRDWSKQQYKRYRACTSALKRYCDGKALEAGDVELLMEAGIAGVYVPES